MQQFIFQDVTPQERITLMEKNANAIERLTYNRHLTSAEIEAEAIKLANLVKECNHVKDDKTIVMKGYNDRIKSLEEQASSVSDGLRSGEKEAVEECYKFINFDTQEVGYYNQSGELVKVRPAMDADLQLNMFHGKGALPQAEEPEVEEAEVVEGE